MAFHRMSRDVLSRPGLLVPTFFWGGWIRRVYDVDKYRMWIPTVMIPTELHCQMISNHVKPKREHIIISYMNT